MLLLILYGQFARFYSKNTISQIYSVNKQFYRSTIRDRSKNNVPKERIKLFLFFFLSTVKVRESALVE